MQKILKGIRQFFHFAQARQAQVSGETDLKGELIEFEQLQKRTAQKQ